MLVYLYKAALFIVAATDNRNKNNKYIINQQNRLDIERELRIYYSNLLNFYKVILKIEDLDYSFYKNLNLILSI